MSRWIIRWLERQEKQDAEWAALPSQQKCFALVLAGALVLLVSQFFPYVEYGYIETAPEPVYPMGQGVAAWEGNPNWLFLAALALVVVSAVRLRTVPSTTWAYGLLWTGTIMLALTTAMDLSNAVFPGAHGVALAYYAMEGNTYQAVAEYNAGFRSPAFNAAADALAEIARVKTMVPFAWVVGFGCVAYGAWQARTARYFTAPASADKQPEPNQGD